MLAGWFVRGGGSAKHVTVTAGAATKLCVNRELGFAVAYPAAWYTARTCTFFDPEPFQVPANSDFTGTALELDAAEASPAVVVSGIVSPDFTSARRQTHATAAGRSATRFEVTSNGNGLLDAGTRIYGYVIDRGTTPPLVVQTTARRGKPLRRDVVDRAVRSLRLFAAANSGAAAGLPAAVEQTRAAIARAARSRDFEALTNLVPHSGFTYTYGGPFEGGAVPYWLNLERTTSDRPFETLARILELPYSLRQGLYVWPFAYGTPRGELTTYERGLLGSLVNAYVSDDYYGWRAGIRPDGTWSFFVSGD